MRKNAFFIILLIVNCFNVLSQSTLPKLLDRKSFEDFSGLPLSEKYGQVSSVKVVYDYPDKKLYFLDSKQYRYHYQFCNDLDNQQYDLDYFNRHNYSTELDRDYLLGNINYYQTLDKYTLEISSSDMMNVDLLINFYQIISENSFFGNKLFLELNSARLLNEKSKLMEKLAVISPSEIYTNLSYQAVGKHRKVGKIKFIHDFETEKDDIKPNDIIVIEKTPIFLPLVSGVIVTEFQTPLSHLSILSKNRKIPICAYKYAFSDSTLRKYENQNVQLTVYNDTFFINPARQNIKQSTEQHRVNISSNLYFKTLIDVKDLDKRSVSYAGNKASNFGILFKISKKGGFKVPESAFAIPFYFYNQHIERCNAKKLIHKMLNDDKIRFNNDSIKAYLVNIQNEILNTPIDSILLQDVCSKIQSLGNYTSMRFRSSTNAEDADGFSGAGLYTSQTGILNSRKKPIDKAIKKVWASLWSYDAFIEREYFNIKHEDVYMGILVHRSFPTEEVNGVAITKNLYREGYYGFVINAQLGDQSVVKPNDGVICDQFICYPQEANELYENKNDINVITISSLNNGKLTMSETEIQKLADQLEIIKYYFKNHYYPRMEYLDFGLDIEFKLDGEQRDLYIKQVRFFND